MHKCSPSSPQATWARSLITWQLGGELRCVPYVLVSTPRTFPLWWKLFRGLSSIKCSRVLFVLGGACPHASLPFLSPPSSYPILHLSLASDPKVAGIMSPSENSFLSFCMGPRPQLSSDSGLWGRARHRCLAASHRLPIRLSRFSWHVSRTTSSPSLGVTPRGSTYSSSNTCRMG